MLTVDKINEWVDEIKQITYDNKGAHSREDKLWETTLEAIAEGVERPDLYAKAALKTKYIHFVRWYT